MMRRLAVVVAALAAALAGAPAQAGVQDEYRDLYAKVADELGKRAPGRNIAEYGLAGGKEPTRAQLLQSMEVLERMLNPPAPAPTAAPATAYGASSTLEAIAACESGGDPGAVSADGLYRGKYQFDYGTWASVGGSGDPAAAPEAEQDMRAQMLYDQRGAQPWPVCGQ
jgi:hypothetical protein